MSPSLADKELVAVARLHRGCIDGMKGTEKEKEDS